MPPSTAAEASAAVASAVIALAVLAAGTVVLALVAACCSVFRFAFELEVGFAPFDLVLGSFLAEASSVTMAKRRRPLFPYIIN